MSINMLHGLNEFILEDGEYSPYDVMFAGCLVPNESDGGYPDIRLWYPLSDKSKSIIREKFKGIDEPDRDIIAWLYSIKDGVYHSFDDVARILNLPVSRVIYSEFVLSKTLFDARDAIYETLSKEAREEIEQEYAAQSYLMYDTSEPELDEP